MHLTRARFAVTGILCAVVVAAGCGGDGSGGSTPVDTAVPGPGSGGSADGATIFAANCAGCHGGNGEGGVGPNLQTSEKAGNKDEVVKQVTEGGGGMPGFGDKLSSAEIQAVADYVVNTVHTG
jgi:mono/diheme cytochrome c family protein